MPRSIKHVARSLFVTMVGLALIIPTSSPASAVEPTASVTINCVEGQPGAAVYSITVNGDIDGHANNLVYDNGYTLNPAPDQGDLFGQYGGASPTESADSVRVVVVDGFTASHIADVMFTRSQCGVRGGGNTPPVAGSLFGFTDRNVPATFPLPGSDADSGDTLTYSLVSQPVHGTASVSGDQLTYTPDGTYLGLESFTYQVDDGNGGTAQGAITIEVTQAYEETPAPPVFHQVSMVTKMASVDLPASETVQYHVYRTTLGGEVVDEGVRTGNFAFSAGETVRVVAEPKDEELVLIGTKEWTYRTYVPVAVLGAANKVENAFKVINPNAVPVKLTWSGTSIWVAANSTQVVATRVVKMVWSAETASGEYVANGTTVTRQVHPTGRITLNCRGSREVTRFAPDNRASNAAVKYDYKIGGVWRSQKVVGAGVSTAVVHRGHLRPGRMIYLYAWTNHGTTHKLIAKVRTPRGC